MCTLSSHSRESMLRISIHLCVSACGCSVAFASRSCAVAFPEGPRLGIVSQRRPFLPKAAFCHIFCHNHEKAEKMAAE